MQLSQLKERGLKVGDFLTGEEVWANGTRHRDYIRVTAIGEESVLARRVVSVTKDNTLQKGFSNENIWTLELREWDFCTEAEAMSFSMTL